MIKAILFDVGGVLNRVRFYAFYKSFLGATEEKIKTIQHFEGAQVRRKLDVGAITLEEYFDEISKEYNLTCSVTEYVAALRSFVIWDDELFTYIKNELKPHYDLYVFSNNSELFIDNEKETFFAKVFSKQFYSHQIKCRKPDLNAYEYVLANIPYDVTECLFIDDKQSNLDVAKSLGMQTLQFVDTDKLKLDLEKLFAIPHAISKE